MPPHRSLEIAGAYYQVVAVPGRLSVRRDRAALDRKREIESRFGGEAAHARRALYARQFLYAWQGLLQEALQGSWASISIDRKSGLEGRQLVVIESRIQLVQF
jgi:hypothetical protein